MDNILRPASTFATSIRRIDFGAYWQHQTADVEADSLTIGYRVARRLAWENRTSTPITGSVGVDR